jgi:hypothetical protein
MRANSSSDIRRPRWLTGTDSLIPQLRAPDAERRRFCHVHGRRLSPGTRAEIAGKVTTTKKGLDALPGEALSCSRRLSATESNAATRAALVLEPYGAGHAWLTPKTIHDPEPGDALWWSTQRGRDLLTRWRAERIMFGREVS